MRFGLRLRAVEPDDASFIIAQRTHPRAVPFLGDTSPNIDAQRAWIAVQRTRAQDAYWICENEAGVALGTIGIYDVHNSVGEWGRLVVRPGSKAAPGCLLLALTHAFEAMGLNEVVCTTVAENARAIAFYERAGLLQDLRYEGHVVLGGRQVPKVLHRVDATRWPEVRATLQAAALRQAPAVLHERH